MNFTLSKSTFMRGMQCPKALYFLKYHPELRDELSQMQQAIFDQGTNVGLLARQLFPGGVNPSTSLPKDYEQCITRTKELIIAGTQVIYEAGFTYNDVHCFVDILVRQGKRWHAYEVKSSTSVTDVHLWDTAIQFFVLKGAGLDLENFSVICLNTAYERLSKLDLQKLFLLESVIDRIKLLQPEVEARVHELKAMLDAGIIPDIDIGPHCYVPYECDFHGHCFQHIPSYSIFDLANLDSKRKWELYSRGILEFKDIPEDFPLNPRQWQQVKADLNGTIHISKAGIRDFLSDLNYPLHFLDFESFQPAVPMFDHSRSYQQIVFQYSLHILDHPGGNLTHHPFLADTAGDPRISFIESLLNNIGNTGDVVVFNRAFEAGRLNEIARDFPVYANKINMITKRIKDLMVPFRQRQYYVPEMRGSYSIKQVLPAVVSGSGYEGLEITDGGMASMVFAGLYYETDLVKLAEARDHLLEYCKMDTFGMVEIIRKLQQII